jgi:hypothetical protein
MNVNWRVNVWVWAGALPGTHATVVAIAQASVRVCPSVALNVIVTPSVSVCGDPVIDTPVVHEPPSLRHLNVSGLATALSITTSYKEAVFAVQVPPLDASFRPLPVNATDGTVQVHSIA